MRTNDAPTQKNLKAYLIPEDVERLEKAATNWRDRLLVRLLFRLGCRVSELLTVAISDIDFALGTITIKHLKVRLRINCPSCGFRLGRGHTYCPGCGSAVKDVVTAEQEHRKVRILPLDKESLDMLNEYIKRGGLVKQGERCLLFGINRHRVWQIVRELAEKAGLPKLINPETGRLHNVSPHRLRDSFAVNAVKVDDSGDGLRLLQEHLGHASFNTTAKYRKVAGEEHRQWYLKLWDRKTNGNATPQA